MGDWREKALVVGIAILYVMFVALSIDALYPRPKYPSIVDYVTDRDDPEKYKQQMKSYEEAQKVYDQRVAVYSRNVFILGVIAGTVPIVIGAVIIPPSAMVVGTGLMYGGILTIIFGTVQYFGEMGKILRIIVTGVALSVLIWVGLKKLNSKKR